MSDVPCHHCLKFTPEKAFTEYPISFIPSKWDFYTQKIRLCPRCVKEWSAYYGSFYLEDLRLGHTDSKQYDPKMMGHLWEIIFRDWFLNTKANPDSVTEMYRTNSKNYIKEGRVNE